jgi:hypothetical protein
MVGTIVSTAAVKMGDRSRFNAVTPYEHGCGR